MGQDNTSGQHMASGGGGGDFSQRITLGFSQASEGQGEAYGEGGDEPYRFVDHTGMGDHPATMSGTDLGGHRHVAALKRRESDDSGFWPATDTLYDAVVQVRGLGKIRVVLPTRLMCMPGLVPRRLNCNVFRQNYESIRARRLDGIDESFDREMEVRQTCMPCALRHS